jgi:hypothetical protein
MFGTGRGRPEEYDHEYYEDIANCAFDVRLSQ